MSDILSQLHEILVAAVLIVTFSLFSYIAIHNWKNESVRALCMLLLGVVVVYAGDALIGRANRPATIQFLLRAQWLGIALVPGAYVHLARALLRAHRGNLPKVPWDWFVWVGYALSALFFWLAVSTDILVHHDSLSSGYIAQFRTGPLFWMYIVFFVSSLGVMLHAILTTRHHALSQTLRRRLFYLSVTFTAPGLGVFPYLVMTGGTVPVSQTLLFVLSDFVSLLVMIMIVVMTYSIAFQGMLQPDRLIKHDFVRWLLYGPLVGVTIILCIQSVGWLETRIGLPSETLIPFAVMIMTVLMPIFISHVRPYIDTLIYMQDRAEITYLRELQRHTFTRTDLRQLLENTLIAVCGTLGSNTGFVVAPSGKDYTIKAWCGSRKDVKQFVADHLLADVVPLLKDMPLRTHETLPLNEAFLSVGNFFLLPLRSPDGIFLGAIGVSSSPQFLASNAGILSHESRHLISVLAHQIELALTTVDMQQRLFDTLRDMGPEVQSLQQLATRLEQATPASLEALDTDVSLQPQFPQLVKEALTHYWGGPKLSDSPLIGLRSVRRLLQEQGGTSTRALQVVLRQAINNLRPDEQLDPSAQEWMLYNLLEMRYLQGKRIRDVANRLAMSESDFYRKQRVAVAEVARQLVLMEEGEKVKV